MIYFFYFPNAVMFILALHWKLPHKHTFGCVFFIIELLLGIFYFVTLFRTISSTYFAMLEHLDLKARKLDIWKENGCFWVQGMLSLLVMQDHSAHWNPINPPNIAPKKVEGAALELPPGLTHPGPCDPMFWKNDFPANSFFCTLLQKCYNGFRLALKFVF